MALPKGALEDPTHLASFALAEPDVAEMSDCHWFVRRLANRHNCTRRDVADPPCAHPQHAEDVAAARQAMIVLGLVEDAPTKQCSACKAVKSIDDFAYFNAGLGGRHAACRACRQQSGRDRRAAARRQTGGV
jgi:hypothetical protein